MGQVRLLIIKDIMQKRITFFGNILMCFTFLVNCSTTQNDTKSADSSFAEVETYLQSLIDTAAIPGITIAITNAQDIVYTKGFGVTNTATKEKLEPKHIFHVASVSKTFTATAVMQLSEKGRLDINKPLITYLPYFKLKDERYKTITIKQMLNHTSGIPDVEDYEWEKAVSDQGAAERYTRSLAEKSLVSNPGSEFHYSNMAFDIMADLISKVSGLSFEKYVKENVLIPLEMNESSFYAPEIKKALRTSPHTGKPPKVSSIYPYNRMHAPSSTLNTNVLELSHWAIAFLNNGKFKRTRIVSDSTYLMMTTPTFTIDDERKQSIGLSWFMYPYLGMTNYEHGGADLGYRSMLTLIPEKKIGIIILSNTEEISLQEVRNKVRDILLSKYDERTTE
jgi:CubicO group peptidase (beta-lactamase class C family)